MPKDVPVHNCFALHEMVVSAYLSFQVVQCLTTCPTLPSCVATQGFVYVLGCSGMLGLPLKAADALRWNGQALLRHGKLKCSQ